MKKIFCLFVFVFVLSSSFMVFANESFELPDGYLDSYKNEFGTDDHEYLLYKKGDVYEFLVIYPYESEGYTCRFFKCGSEFGVVNAGAMHVYNSDNGKDWTFSCGRGMGAINNFGSLEGVEILASSSPVYVTYEYIGSISDDASYDGEIFFWITPPVAKMALPLMEMIPKQMMKILPTAICCLALLIGSVVLLPRLKTFLVRL